MNLKLISKEEIKGRAGAFFSSKGWKNTLVFFGFVVLASGFWALQYFRQTFEFEVPIKVHYVHAPIGVALSDELPHKITLHVQDKGSAYLGYLNSRRKHLLFITIDLRTIPSYQTSYVIDQVFLRNLIDTKLFATTQLKSFSPNIIEINYSLLAQKKVPITINGTISPAFGYLFSDSIRIEPAQVTAYGNKAALDTLREIQTIPVGYDNLQRDWTASADLQVPEGIRLAVDQVELSASVEEYTEKTFKLPVICYNVPYNYVVYFFPSTIELAVKVGLSKYSQLSEYDFEITVNYDDLKKKTTANCSLTLTRKPLGLDSYRIVPDVIEFLIEQKVINEDNRPDRRNR